MLLDSPVGSNKYSCSSDYSSQNALHLLFVGWLAWQLNWGRSRKFSKRRSYPPPPHPEWKLQFSGHAAYGIVGIFVMQSKVTLTFQKHFENTRKKGGPRPLPQIRLCSNPNQSLRSTLTSPTLPLWQLVDRPGVRFSKDLKTSLTRKPSCKAPETTFGCFSKHPKNFEPEKYVIFPRKLHGYSLPPENGFRVCFSCTCLIKWCPPTYFLGQNKRPRSCIKRERVEEGRENNLVKKYGFYQNEFQWLIAVIFNRQISKHYRVQHESQSQRNFHTCQAVWSVFDFFCSKFLTKPPKFVQQLSKTKSYKVLNDWDNELQNSAEKEHLQTTIPPNFQDLKTTRTCHSARASQI